MADDPPLLPSQGVGTGGAGHVCSGSRSVFRLPPPIPGKPGGGYPSEWHSATNTIRRNWLSHVARKRARGDTLQEVKLDAAVAGGTDGTGERVRKRDVLMKWVGDAKSSISQVADQVYKREAVQKTAASVTGAVAAAGARVNEIKATVSTKAVQVGELAAERKAKYAGLMMDKVGTPAIGAAAAVGFYLAKQREGQESAFDMARKQERVEVVDISARNSIKTSLIVKPGDTLNWTFAIKSMDLMFHVKLRKMMDVGGSEEEDLVPSIKVDASSIAEGTWTCAQEGQGGQVVLCWDNTRSLLRSKSIAYRTWLVKGDAANEPSAQSLGNADVQAAQVEPASSEQGNKAEAAQDATTADAAAARQEEQQHKRVAEEAARKAAEAQEAADKAAKLEAEALALKQAEAKKLEEAAAQAKAEEEKAAAAAREKEEEQQKEAAAEEAARKEQEKRLEEAAAQAKAEEEKAAAAARELEEEQQKEAARKAAEAQEAADKAAKLEAEALALKQAEEKKLEEEEAQAKAEEEKAAEFFGDDRAGEDADPDEGEEGVGEGGEGGSEEGTQGAGDASASASKKKKKKKK